MSARNVPHDQLRCIKHCAGDFCLCSIVQSLQKQRGRYHSYFIEEEVTYPRLLIEEVVDPRFNDVTDRDG